MKNFLQLNLLLLIVLAWTNAALGSNSSAEIQNINVQPDGDKVNVQVKLTRPVTPRVVIATKPDRLVLELPNTTAQARQEHIAVNRKGVRELRVGLTSAVPLVTRLVIDLDSARPYGLSMVGNMIALTVLPADQAQVSENNTPSAVASNPEVSALASSTPLTTHPAAKQIRAGFKVKYVAEGVAYLAGGRGAGLAAGMKLTVIDTRGKAGHSIDATSDFSAVAELEIVSVAETSAVTEVHEAIRQLKPGDWAYLSVEETQEIALNRLTGRRRSTSSGDAAGASENTFRASRPEPRALETGRVRGRIGFDYSGFSSSGSTTGSSSTRGMIARTDITNIGGTHWNLEGYWRGRLTRKSRADEDTLQNVLNKTYTMQLTYGNPESKWVAGFGRLYLPWANSLDTIDGGYLGRRISSSVTAGMFAGSTPDPTSWHYNPNQEIAGSFVNFEGGSSDAFRYTSTTGIAINMLKWKLDRPFVFFENGVSFRNSISVYHSLIADSPQGLTTDGITPGAGISRSYLTVHLQPYRRISFDIYHNYFRDVPTAATALIGTGMVDKLLYQGLSAGVRVEPVRHFFVYTTLGKSDKTGDTRRSLNQMYGLTWDEIGRTGLRADLRYSKFDSSFGNGDYKLLTVSRHLGDRMMWDAQVGMQSLHSNFTVNNSSNFFDTSLDMNLFGKSFFQSGYTIVRGSQMNYNQWYLSLGYRFDSKPSIR